MSNIEKRIRDVVSEQLGAVAEDIKLTDDFRDDLGADSLDVVELVMALEEEFDTEISDDEAETIHTVEKAIHYIENNQN
jgi:acyl carrier protein